MVSYGEIPLLLFTTSESNPLNWIYSKKVSGGNKKSLNRPAPLSLLFIFSAAAAEPEATKREERKVSTIDFRCTSQFFKYCISSKRHNTPHNCLHFEVHFWPAKRILPTRYYYI